MPAIPRGLPDHRILLEHLAGAGVVHRHARRIGEAGVVIGDSVASADLVKVRRAKHRDAHADTLTLRRDAGTIRELAERVLPSPCLRSGRSVGGLGLPSITTRAG
jgi:hypothetical protein